MFENPRRGRQARNFKTNVPKILVLKSSSEQIFSRKLPLGAPDYTPSLHHYDYLKKSENDKTKEKFWLWDETKKSFMSELDGVRNYLTKISS